MLLKQTEQRPAEAHANAMQAIANELRTHPPCGDGYSINSCCRRPRRGRVPLLQCPIDNPLHPVGEACQRPHPSHHSAAPRGQAIDLFLPSPGAHAVGHTLIGVSRADGGLYACEPKPLSDLVAHPGKGEGDAPALQLLDRAQQDVAAGGVCEVQRIGIHKDMIRRWPARRERGLQSVVEVADTREEQVATDPPNQQARERDRLGMATDVAIGLGAGNWPSAALCGWLVRYININSDSATPSTMPCGTPSVSSPASTIAARINSQRLRPNRSRKYSGLER